MSAQRPVVAQPPRDDSKSADSKAAASEGLRQRWRSYLLWTGVAVVCAGIILVVVLCVLGRKGGSVRPHPSQELQITVIDRRPKGDYRSYQYTTLPNGLQVVNVQDDASKTSAYSMAVKAGSFDDPTELPGLAHFCEHMLFLGTKSHPDPSGYDNFVSSNGGYLNAWTDKETTVYYTELSSSAAGQGLSHFADFFRAPLFSEGYVEREVHAIDSEHAKNMQDPTWRVNSLMNSLANPASPVAGFHTGNFETLFQTPRQQGIDPVASLRTWFQDHYCPSRYQLVTYGPEDLRTQLERAYEDFNDISEGSEKCQEGRHSWHNPIAWNQSTLGHWANIQGMQPQSELIVFFPLPDISKEYLSQPLEYIEYAITYGGQNGFVKTIRDTLGLASSIGVSAESSSAGTSIYFTCRLAQAGREHPGLVLDLLFQYLHLLRYEGVDQALHLSLANLTKLAWDWAQAKGPADTASDLAERMTRLPPTRLLSGDDIIEEPNGELVANLLAKITPDRMNVGLVDPDAQKRMFVNKEVLTAPFYGTKYTMSTVDKQLPGHMARWQAWEDMTPAEVAKEVDKKLHSLKLNASAPMPPNPIHGVRADFSLKHMRATQVVNNSDQDQHLFGRRPQQLQDLQEELEGETVDDQELVEDSWGLPMGRHSLQGSSTREAWFRAGWVNPSPKVQMQFLLRPRLDADATREVNATSALRLGFYTSFLAEELVPELFDQTVAGASFDIALGVQGDAGTLSLAFDGFPPLLPHLIRQTVQAFDKGVKVEDNVARYERIYREYEESFLDYSGMPVDYALSDRNLLLTPGTHSQEESLAALRLVTPASVQSAPDKLVKQRPLDLTALVMGNIGVAQAEDAVDWVMAGLTGVQSSIGSGEGQLQHLPPVVKPARPLELRKRNPREGDTNDAIVVSLLAGVATVESRVILGIIGQILSVLAYNDLRTERQLGYVVTAGVGQMSNVQYVSTIVQGETARADDMEVAVEHVYFQLMPERLRNLTHNEFLTYKDSFKHQLLQPPSGRSEEFSHYWSHIMNGGVCFGLLNEMLEFLKHNLTSKDALIEAWANVAMPPDHQPRHKVTVKYFADKVPPRPSVSDMTLKWMGAGLDMDASERMGMEYEQTKVLSNANSTIRKEIYKEGAYYPTTLYCTRESTEKKKARQTKSVTGGAEGRQESAAAIADNETKTVVPPISPTDADPAESSPEGSSSEDPPAKGASMFSTETSIAEVARPENATMRRPPVRGQRAGQHFLQPQS